MQFLKTLIPLLLASTASSYAVPTTAQVQLPSRQIYQFENGTWVENIAVRENGNLLVTLLDRPEIYELDPFDPTPKLIHRFPDYIGLLGITETQPNIFAIVAGNFTLAHGTEPRSFAIWKLNMRKNQEPVISKITDVPEVVFGNGMTTLDSTRGIVLFSDSTRGVVTRLDTRSGKYEDVLHDKSFQPSATAPVAIGINGIRYHQGYLYYTNTFNPLFGRVRIDKVTGMAIGPYETLATGSAAGSYPDDFAIRSDAAYIAGNLANIVTEFNANGKSHIVAGGLHSTTVAGATSAAFGRTSYDHNILYVVTGGAQAAPVNGTYTEGGKIVAVDVSQGGYA